MTLRAIQLPPTQWAGIDTVSPVFPKRAQALVDADIWWVARYLRLSPDALDEPDSHGGDHHGCWSTSRAEIQWITDAGLGLVLVQWGPERGETVDAGWGDERGLLAAEQATALGIPHGVHLYADIEGAAAERGGANGIIGALRRFAHGPRGRGCRAGSYLSGRLHVTGRGLYSAPGITSYWRSATTGGPQEPHPRGWSIRQGLPTEIAGVPCDPDILGPDGKGEMPWIVGSDALIEHAYAEWRRRGIAWVMGTS